jgi:hypothetical protein
VSLVPVRGYQPLRNVDFAVKLPFEGVINLAL